MKKIPVTVVDDFFEDPYKIRDLALKCDFDYPRGFYPGYRSDHLFNLDRQLYDKINFDLINLFFDPYRDKLEIEVESQFQYIPAKFEEGWVHQDLDVNQRDLAGVIYLTPDAPSCAGTAIYEKIKETDDSRFRFRNEFYSTGKYESLKEYQAQRELHNDCFSKSVEVYNKFNRLLIYDTEEFHKESKFFGNDKLDSRMTLCFFISVKLYDRSQFTLDKFRKHRLKL